jgi:hypothetical protein
MRSTHHQDGVQQVWEKFFTDRTRNLNERFQGVYRAVVVETNDPLRHHRVRVRVPELHNHDLKAEKLPWAVISPWFGGSGCGSWVSPSINDLVWVEFEKSHPYFPIVIGFANPTRRKFYVLESVYGQTPVAVDVTGKPAGKPKPQDYLEDYMPKDNRPMSVGWRDRYGSFFVMNSVGFFPKEHDIDPSPVGQDAISKNDFNSSKDKPEVNEPDTKLIALCSKYGHYMVLNDVGYSWKKDEKKDPAKGEFEGDFDKDFEFEVNRAQYLQRLFNEDKPKERDQRRFEIRTRYGHKLEMRDVGWGNKPGSTRENEYSKSRQQIAETPTEEKDERWFKLRTKGGHLVQMWDYGNDPVDDAYVKRELIKEVGGATDVDQEDQWQGRGDARQIRVVTRYGFKFVLDDRGSDKTNATGLENPRGNGLLIKGRRKAFDDQRGFGIEFNEKDAINSVKMYSPKSKVLEINDRYDYIMLCTDMEGPISEPWRNLYDNEFTRRQSMTFDPERNTYHLKLDKANGYIRLVTKEQQGIEMRDGVVGDTWVETRDIEDRGLWFSKDYSASVLRSREGTKIFIVMDDAGNNLLIQNNEDGILQIYAKGPIQIKSDDSISMEANTISLKAKQQIQMEGGGAHASLKGGVFGADVTASFPKVLGYLSKAAPGTGTQSSAPVSCSPPSITRKSWATLRPDKFDKDRGRISQTKPTDFAEVDIKVIRGQSSGTSSDNTVSNGNV